MKIASPLNIWSGSSEMNGLGAALTNPTELSFKKGKIKHHYPVVFNNQSLLEQHPQLLSAITFRGGVAWLKTCSHRVRVKSSRWEGVGRKSNFIACLIEAYTEVIADIPF